MKLFIDGKYREVGFWSFVKCNIFVELLLGLIIYSLIFIIAVLSTLF